MHHFSQSARRCKQATMGWILCIAITMGCGHKYTPVNVGTAKEALLLVLDSWKEGKKPDDLQEESPPITVEEFEWRKGAKLVDYEIVSDDTPADSSLVAWVKLKLHSADGQVIEQTAKYVVSTSPELTVLRIMMR